jgi:hypothetical protein
VVAAGFEAERTRARDLHGARRRQFPRAYQRFTAGLTCERGERSCRSTAWPIDAIVAQITRILHPRDSDMGHPLSDLATTLQYPDLHAEASETLRNLAFSAKEISESDGHGYTVRIVPCRTVANVIHAAVTAFLDITAAREFESRLRKARHGRRVKFHSIAAPKGIQIVETCHGSGERRGPSAAGARATQ